MPFLLLKAGLIKAGLIKAGLIKAGLIKAGLIKAGLLKTGLLLAVPLQIESPPTNLPFLFAAFAVSWLGFFAYAFFVSRRRQELEREIRDLRQSLEQRETAEGDHPAG